MIQLALGKTKSSVKILCMGAHCDDIEIGCGGTLLRMIGDYRGNVLVRWVVFSANPERRREALQSAQAILSRLKQKTITIQSFDDSFFPFKNAGEIKEFMHQLSREFSPDLIFTHHSGDLHQDHRLISELTWNAFRNHCILEYEIPKYDGDLGSPNFFVTLEDDVRERKIELLMRFFQTQANKHWFSPETFNAILRIRGIESKSPSGYAEAFYGRKLSF